LETALLVWHAYRGEGSRWLFVPPEIRNPGEAPAMVLPALVEVAIGDAVRHPWVHPDAVAWDLLTILRMISDPQAPAWEASDVPPRWLRRAATTRFWFRGLDGPPEGYLELLTALGLAEGMLAIDDDARPRRVVVGPHARAWRGRSFGAQTTRLRERWLRLARWTEGEPAGLVEVWGADWRGMRPRLLAALADPELELIPGTWVTLESLAARLAARYPTLLGPSFMAATARQTHEAAVGLEDDEARAAALADVIALELGGAFAWFGLTRVVDAPGQPRAICLTETGAALAARKSLPAIDDPGAGHAPLVIEPSGEIALRAPTPERVWALSAIAEQVDLGPESHYRLTPGSVGAALAAGIERDQIAGLLERGSRQPLPPDLAANLATWSKSYRLVRLRRAVILRVDDHDERAVLLQTLRDSGWQAEPVGDQAVLVPVASGDGDAARGEDGLVAALRAAGLAPRWVTARDEAVGPISAPASSTRGGQAPLPDGD
jgi:hypothetical protein